VRCCAGAGPERLATSPRVLDGPDLSTWAPFEHRVDLHDSPGPRLDELIVERHRVIRWGVLETHRFFFLVPLHIELQEDRVSPATCARTVETGRSTVTTCRGNMRRVGSSFAVADRRSCFRGTSTSLCRPDDSRKSSPRSGDQINFLCWSQGDLACEREKSVVSQREARPDDRLGRRWALPERAVRAQAVRRGFRLSSTCRNA
jgi:hypothetical protein